MIKHISIICLSLLLMASNAISSPQTSMKKLLDAVADNRFAQGLPNMPLTEQEAKELANFLREQYKSMNGVELDDTQAAVYAGMVCGVVGVKNALEQPTKEHEQKIGRKPEKTQTPTTPVGNLFETWPSGQTAVKAKNLKKMFESDPVSTASFLEGKKIAVVGEVEHLIGATPPQGEQSKNAMLLLDGVMCVLEEIQGIPLEKTKPGQSALLECRKIFFDAYPKGLCKVIGIGPKKDGVMDTWYTNKELKNKYLTAD